MKNTITFLLLVSFSIAFGQNTTLTITKINSLKYEADAFFGLDQFGFYYLIKNNVLHKIKGTESFEYKNPTLGKLTKVDVQNPLKIVLFYEGFNSVVLLDNQLNEIQKINFSENKTPINVTATGIASQNQLWIYDSLNQQIGLYNYLRNNYKAISTSFPQSIRRYQSDFNTFYWVDEKNNWYGCDIFGKIALKGKIPDFDMLEIVNDQQIIYSKNDILIWEDFGISEKHEIKIVEKTFKNFTYKDQILSIFTSDAIINYKITIP